MESSLIDMVARLRAAATTVLLAANILPGMAQVSEATAPGSLSERWELTDSLRRGCWQLRPYRPLYFLPVNWTDDINEQPTTPNPETTVPLAIPYQNVELKFQLSLKFKAVQGIFGGHGDLWFAYSQTSRWQMYNSDLSRVFRETNYEPEVVLNFPTNVSLGRWRLSMAGIGVVHQSNGRSLFLTRSWNRVVGQVGIEKAGWAMVLRPWWRIPEDADVDENPEVEEYIGRAELLVIRSWHRHVISAQGRHSLEWTGRGSLQLDWAIPVGRHLHIHAQCFHGYGESMIDYNYKQTTLGVGISLTEWM